MLAALTSRVGELGWEADDVRGGGEGAGYAQLGEENDVFSFPP